VFDDLIADRDTPERYAFRRFGVRVQVWIAWIVPFPQNEKTRAAAVAGQLGPKSGCSPGEHAIAQGPP